jgi:hypothetical protein
VQAYDATYLVDADIGVNIQGYDVDTAKTDVIQTFTAAQRGTVVTLTDAANITPDFSVANNFEVVITDNRILDNPINVAAGQSGVIMIKQDATGLRTLTFGANWAFPAGTAPTLTETALASDILCYYCASPALIYANVLLDMQ